MFGPHNIQVNDDELEAFEQPVVLVHGQAPPLWVQLLVSVSVVHQALHVWA